MRYVRYLILALIGLGLLTLAMANRDPVVVRAVPDSVQAVIGGVWSMQMPLFLAIFGGVVLGLVIGFVWEWLRETRHRSEATLRAREVARLEHELASVRAEKGGHKDDVLALLDNRSV
jgi:lipopolysaccharide assembly protein A